MPDFPHLLRPGQTPTASDWNALVSLLAQVFRSFDTAPGATGSGISITGGGLGSFQVRDLRQDWHWGKIGTGSGANYAHTQAILNDSGFEDLPATPDNIYGTTSKLPARELSGNTAVPSGTYVKLYPNLDDDDPGYAFEYAASTPASSWKTPAVRASTTAALPANTYANGSSGVGATLTGNSNGALSAQDGVTLNLNDPILVKNEATASHNGIYVLTQVGSGGTPYILTRRADANTGALLLGATVAVEEGVTNADTIWLGTADATITVGTTALPWILIGPPPSTSLSWKQTVRVATAAAGTLSTSFANGQTVDSITLATGDRILIKDQATASENGIYTVNASGAPTRATDANTGALLLGACVAVQVGMANADTVWLGTANAPITVGATNLPWVLVGPPPVLGTGTDQHLVRWNGTGTQTIQDSLATLDNTGYLTTSQLNLQGGTHPMITPSTDAGLYLVNDLYLLIGSVNVSTGDVIASGGKGYFGNTIETNAHYICAGLGGITTTCTVVVGGVNKTMTITGGIVTDIS